MIAAQRLSDEPRHRTWRIKRRCAAIARFETSGRLGRIDDRFSERPLAFSRQANDGRFFDGLVRSFLRSPHDEFAYAPTLNLGGAFDNCQRLGRDARLDACGANRFLRHQNPLSF